MKVNVESYINIDPAIRAINSVGYFAAVMLHKDMQELIPKREGQLSEKNVKFAPWEIKYYAPYAVYPYTGEHMNFRKDPHSKAGAYWDKRFVQEKTSYEKWVKSVGDEIKKKL